MFTAHIKRNGRMTLLGCYPTFEEAQKAALDWWCTKTQVATSEALKGAWLESFDHQKDTRLWFFMPEVSTLDALGWIMPGCEIRSAA